MSCEFRSCVIGLTREAMRLLCADIAADAAAVAAQACRTTSELYSTASGANGSATADASCVRYDDFTEINNR